MQDEQAMTGAHQGTSNISFCFATIERPHCARRLIRSIRQHFPAAPIFVGDQSAKEHDQAAFYQEQGVTAVYLAYDSGVCHARNAVVAQVRTPYLVLCDDDFIVDADTNFDLALNIFEHNSHIMVVGGRVIDIGNADTRQGEDRHWESFFFLDQRTKILVQLPIYSFRPLEGRAGAHRFFYCDAVLNFAMMRTALFQQHGHRWDERFKCNGEHEDFYLSLMARKELGVAYIPEMVIYHHNVSGENYGALRNRQEGWMLFAEKWGVDQFYDCFKDLNLRFFSGLSEASIDSRGFWQDLVDLPHGANEQVFFRKRSHDLAAEVRDLHGHIDTLKKEIEVMRAERAATGASEIAIGSRGFRKDLIELPHQQLTTRTDVVTLYREMLGREPESEEVVAARCGQPLLDLALEFARAEEFRSLARCTTREDVVTLYREMLGREPESEEMVAARCGQPLLELVLEFTRAEEFRSLARSTIREDVVTLHREILGREPE